MKKLADFSLLKKLGQGGYGVVYKAKDVNGEIVAIKTCRSSKDSVVSIFQREIFVLSKMHHPNIVAFRGAGIDNNTHFLCMQYVPGESLLKKVEKKGPIHPQRAKSYIHQSAQALKFVESLNYVHRDIKPENIIINRNRVKIIDFGLTQAWDFNLYESANDMFGTPSYMAPEYIQGECQLTSKYDIYSLGISYYYILRGMTPFGKEDWSPEQIFKEHVRRATPRIPGISSKTNYLIQSMTAKRPEERPTLEDIIKETED